MTDTERKDIAARAVAQVSAWYHSIDLGNGIVSPGHSPVAAFEAEWAHMAVPDLAGKTVLDVGTWDGWFAFEAERRGARRVVALDHYAWSIDWRSLEAYWAQCRETGRKPQESHLVSGVWKPDLLPGKKGFDTAHRILESRVEAVVADFMTDDLAPLGTFDVVFFRGVLYHLKDPLGALERLFRVTGDLAIIETAAIRNPGTEHLPLFEFYGRDELNGDMSNWWAPNRTALLSATHAAGFREVGVVFESQPENHHGRTTLGHDVVRLTVHARPPAQGESNHG